MAKNNETDKNSVWQYFNRNKDNDTGTCNIDGCKTKIKAAGGSTSGLHAHLRSQHKINLLKRTDSSSSSTVSTSKSAWASKSQNYSTGKITSYFVSDVDESFAATVSRMTAKDGFAFAKFTDSYELRKLLSSKVFRDIPKSPHTIKRHVMEYKKKYMIL